MSEVPSIPVMYEVFPDNYINDINGWSFDKETIKKNAGKLLTLDIDFGSKCSLNCPYCFRRGNSVDLKKHRLQSDDLKDIIRQAKDLGLRSVKFLGAGEPLENPRILDFIEFLKEVAVTPVLFTKTGIIGEDSAVSKHFSKYNLKTGIDLAEELYRLDVSVVLGFNSFNDEAQARMVGNGPDYVRKRNGALDTLVKVGFNSTNPTRLALGINPITRQNVNEAYEIYQWARVRNIYAIVTPTMVSGRAKEGRWRSLNPPREKLIDLYTQVYKFNLNTELTQFDKLIGEGISAYAGGHPCNQVSCGLYITLNGVVLSCPGSEENIEGNIWESSLRDIWYNSSNYRRTGTFNCCCVAKDGRSIPGDLYPAVLDNISKHLGKSP